MTTPPNNRRAAETRPAAVVGTVVCWRAAAGQQPATASLCGCVRCCALDGSPIERFPYNRPDTPRPVAVGLHHGNPAMAYPVYDASDVSATDILVANTDTNTDDAERPDGECRGLGMCVQPGCPNEAQPAVRAQRKAAEAAEQGNRAVEQWAADADMPSQRRQRAMSLGAQSVSLARQASDTMARAITVARNRPQE